jgi:ABC-2 type transport system ATP-binding protein
VSSSILVKVEKVSKCFGKARVLNNVSFEIPKGSVLGILGPNGSGKSTLMRIIAGLIKTWDGSIYFDGKPITEEGMYLHRVGFLIEDPAFYEHLTAAENLIMLSRLTNSPLDDIERLLKEVDLNGSEDKLVKNFSYGMKQRLGIAQAILNDPDILFLDEPSNGLDPHGIVQMNETIVDLNKKGKTICLSTHVVEHVKDLCSHIIILKEGNLVLDDSIESLFENSKKYEIKSKNIEPIKNKLSQIEGLTIVEETDKKLTIDSELDLSDLLKTFSENNDLYSINKKLDIQDLFS